MGISVGDRMMLGAAESVARHSAVAVVLYAGMVALTAHLSDPWTIEGHDAISEANVAAHGLCASPSRACTTSVGVPRST